MNKNTNQPWVFFWTSSDSGHYPIRQEKEFAQRCKVQRCKVRQALLDNVLGEDLLEDPPQAS